MKSTRELKSIGSSTRSKDCSASLEEDNGESFAEDSEKGGDEDFRSTKRGEQVHIKNGGQSAPISVFSRKNELE